MSEHEVNEFEHAVREAEERLAEAKRKRDHQEYPKFVEPHASHVVRTKISEDAPVHVSVPMFPEFHVDRDGKVTVKVADADHEAKALAVKEAE